MLTPGHGVFWKTVRLLDIETAISESSCKQRSEDIFYMKRRFRTSISSGFNSFMPGKICTLQQIGSRTTKYNFQSSASFLPNDLPTFCAVSGTFFLE